MELVEDTELPHMASTLYKICKVLCVIEANAYHRLFFDLSNAGYAEMSLIYTIALSSKLLCSVEMFLLSFVFCY